MADIRGIGDAIRAGLTLRLRLGLGLSRAWSGAPAGFNKPCLPSIESQTESRSRDSSSSVSVCVRAPTEAVVPSTPEAVVPSSSERATASDPVGAVEGRVAVVVVMVAEVAVVAG